MKTPRIIAMWSGPRNVSTALMYSFAQRADTCVWDEPYYAAWLQAAGEPHPLADEIVAASPADPVEVARRITAPTDRPTHYQKHMAHHMRPEFDIAGWFEQAIHAFLIREPASVLASYTAKYDHVSLDLIGLPQQVELFERAADLSGKPPTVVRGRDIQAKPEAALRQLTAALGLDFDPSMLSWPAGPKSYDGRWASHWYDRVWSTTGFAPPPSGSRPALPAPLARIAEMAAPLYERLEKHAIRV